MRKPSFNTLGTAFLLAAGVLLSIAFTTGFVSAVSCPGAVPNCSGDANGDGEISAGDITKVERIILGWDAQTNGSDANVDGTVNATDIGVIEYMIMEIWPWNVVHLELYNTDMSPITNATNRSYCHDFVAVVYITHIEDLDSAQYDIVYDGSVLDITDVTNGSVQEGSNFWDVDIPAWGLIPPAVQGRVRIINTIPGASGVNGSGYLAKVHFHVDTMSCKSSNFDFIANSTLFDSGWNPIPSITWQNSSTFEVYPCHASCTPTASATPTVTATATITATPTPKPTCCLRIGADGGTVQPWCEDMFWCEHYFWYGEHVFIGVNHFDCWDFVEWIGDVEEVGDVYSRLTWITMNDDYTIYASMDYWGAGSTYVPTIEINSTDGGSVTWPGEGEFDLDCNEQWYIDAEPDAGCEFVKWTCVTNDDFCRIDDIYSPSTTVTFYHIMHSLTAHFSCPSCTPTTTATATATASATATVTATGTATCTIMVNEWDFFVEQTGSQCLGCPASCYCEELGYNSSIEEGPLGQYGVCTFPDSTFCEEWSFMTGQCGQNWSFCEQQGGEIITVSSSPLHLCHINNPCGYCILGCEE